MAYNPETFLAIARTKGIGAARTYKASFTTVTAAPTTTREQELRDPFGERSRPAPAPAPRPTQQAAATINQAFTPAPALDDQKQFLQNLRAAPVNTSAILRSPANEGPQSTVVSQPLKPTLGEFLQANAPPPTRFQLNPPPQNQGFVPLEPRVNANAEPTIVTDPALLGRKPTFGEFLAAEQQRIQRANDTASAGGFHEFAGTGPGTTPTALSNVPPPTSVDATSANANFDPNGGGGAAFPNAQNLFLAWRDPSVFDRPPIMFDEDFLAMNPDLRDAMAQIENVTLTEFMIAMGYAPVPGTDKWIRLSLTTVPGSSAGTAVNTAQQVRVATRGGDTQSVSRGNVSSLGLTNWRI